MNETPLRIRIFPDPALRKISKPVTRITDRQRDTLSRMARVMYEGNGIGLAGPQVGINEQLIVVDIGTGLYKLVNPRITKKQGRQSLSEGCLSIPGICIKVKRANKILVRALDEEGVKQDIEAEGLLACVLQHEIDHLKGRIIIDYASIIEKFKIKKTLKELKKKVKCGRPPSGNKNTCQLEL